MSYICRYCGKETPQLTCSCNKTNATLWSKTDRAALSKLEKGKKIYGSFDRKLRLRMALRDKQIRIELKGGKI